MRKRLYVDKRAKVFILVVMLVLLLGSFAAYLVTGIVLKADLPLVRNFCTPDVFTPINQEAVSIAETWKDVKVYTPTEYKTMFSVDETEDQFYERMSDVDRRSLYQLTQRYPDLLKNGLSQISFDATQTQVSALLDVETDSALRADILAGAVKTKEGHTIVALDGTKSMLLIKVNLNQTDGYVAITYDKTKVKLSVTKTAFEGWWGTMLEHLKQNASSVVAIPANNYTYNSKAGYGVVDGGFVDNAIPRYKMSENMSYYMGFNREGLFNVGVEARYGSINFTEGLGTLLSHGAVPVVDVVPTAEREQIFEALATYIKATGEDTEEKGYDGIPVIKAFIKSFDSNMMRAKVSWVIKNQALLDAVEDTVIPEKNVDVSDYVTKMKESTGASKKLKELERLVKICDKFGASEYVPSTVPVHSAYNAIGQRERDGAILLFGIGGAKKADMRNLPGNGATISDMQALFLEYEVSNAAITTSGDRVGFGWKDQNLLHVQDTADEGGRSYGAYILY